MKTISKYYITEHGIENEQYFQGHGTALTEYEDSATGIGGTPKQAFHDALENLAQNGWDVESLEPLAEELNKPTDYYDFPIKNEACYFYVSVDVKSGFPSREEIER